MTKDITLPVRLQVRADDSTPGQYPTIPRVGDARTGFFAVSPFDDSTTVIFQDAVLEYPTGTPSGSGLALGQTSSIEASGRVVPGIGDTFVDPLDIQPFTPFDETDHPEQASSLDPFYASGSDVAIVGDGFQGRLSSKTRLIIDLTPDSTTDVIARNKSTHHADPADPVYPMVYFNHATRRWEGIFQGLPYDYTLSGANPNSANLQDQTLAFTHWANLTTSDPDVRRSYASPSSAWGFPYDVRYHATSSQLFEMAGLIDRPFIVEKLVYEFSASAVDSSVGHDLDASHPSIMTFFILNQRSPFPTSGSQVVRRVSPTATPYRPNSGIPRDVILTSISGSDPATRVNDIRELVTYMQVSAVARYAVTQSLDDPTIESLKRDLNFVLDHRVDSAPIWTGSFVMSASCRAPELNATLNVDSEGDFILGWPLGTRTGLGVTTGRSLVQDVGGNLPSKSVTTFNGTRIFTNVSSSHVDPYILLPSDRLVFGWEVPDDGPFADPGEQLSLMPGKGKLFLYGSLVQAGVQRHDASNEPLTSEAAHEAVGTAMVLDQLDVEPRQQFSGSMLGEYVTGSMSLVGPTRGVVVGLVASQSLRGVFPSVITHASPAFEDHVDPSVDRATVPGFLRGSQFVSSNERFWDTLMPRIDQAVRLDGSLIIRHQSVNTVLLGGDANYTNGMVSITQSTDTTWNQAFPFEPRYASVDRTLSIPHDVHADVDLFTGTAVDGSGFNVTKDPRPLNLVRQLATTDNPTSDFTFLYLGPLDLDNTATVERDLSLHLYGVGSFYSGSVEGGFRGISTFNNNTYTGSRFRGFKYGVHNPLPQFTRVVYRWDRFGQLRDLLEQRLDGKLYDTLGVSGDGTLNGRPGQRDGVVRVQFVKPRSVIATSPDRTWSSNLSLEATSSLPYFDGRVRNREDPLNVAGINVP